jgi:mannose-1-phosphate guanylyltransferase
MIAHIRPLPSRDLERVPRSVSHAWGIVLAGNDGPVPEFGRDHGRRMPGERRPLRACRTESGLLRTLERVMPAIPAHRLVAVFSRDNAPVYTAELGGMPDVQHVVQPRYRGSAAEVFLPVLRIARQDPDAVVAVLPADHLDGHDARITDYIAMAVSAASLRPDLPVLVGAHPQRQNPTYGWIEPGDPVDGLETFSIRCVRRFVHDRAFTTRRWLSGDSALLSTVAMVANARTLLDLGRRYLPEVLEALEPLEEAPGATEERLLCEAVYEWMPYASLARELLERGDHFAVLPLPEVRWHECAPTTLELLAS